jgi:hypothetical protein
LDWEQARANAFGVVKLRLLRGGELATWGTVARDFALLVPAVAVAWPLRERD